VASNRIPSTLSSGPSESASDIDRGQWPPLHLVPLEGVRLLVELGALAWSWPLLARAPRGDDHPVLVLPGFLATDGSTAVMRRYLTALGYDAQGWQLGRNLGGNRGTYGLARERLDAVAQQSGRKVSLIGWSLGGTLARELARHAPMHVRQVITLGSPLYGDTRRTTSAWLLHRAVHGRDSINHGDYRGIGAPPVPTTSVFDRHDGVVSWRTSVEFPGPQVQSVETLSSHIGFGFNPLVFWLLADRLAQPEGQWQPFVPPPALRDYYRALQG
jgi:pimeloyl-ACP methyl ester carboxylesterase